MLSSSVVSRVSKSSSSLCCCFVCFWWFFKINNYFPFCSPQQLESYNLQLCHRFGDRYLDLLCTVMKSGYPDLVISRHSYDCRPVSFSLCRVGHCVPQHWQQENSDHSTPENRSPHSGISVSVLAEPYKT